MSRTALVTACAVALLPFANPSAVARSTTVCATALEVWAGLPDSSSLATLTCPPGYVITSIDFASYGTPTGECGAFGYGTCHAPTSLSVVRDVCIGQASCSVRAQNVIFGGDPCLGTYKRLYVQATCERADSSSTGSQCEGTNVALGKPANASSSWLPCCPPSRAVDGDTLSSKGWNAGDGVPQWIEIDLGAHFSVACLRLLADMLPDGQVAHFVEGRTATGTSIPLGSFVGPAAYGQWLSIPSTDATPVQYVRVTTTASPSWVAWIEVEVLAATPVEVRRGSWGALKSIYR